MRFFPVDMHGQLVFSGDVMGKGGGGGGRTPCGNTTCTFETGAPNMCWAISNSWLVGFKHTPSTGEGGFGFRIGLFGAGSHQTTSPKTIFKLFLLICLSKLFSNFSVEYI